MGPGPVFFSGVPLDSGINEGRILIQTASYSYRLARFGYQLEESGSVEPRPKCVPRHEIYGKT